MNENHLTVLRAWAMEKSATGVNCPGGKLRSRGMGRGLGLGQGMGPRGIPIGEKMKALVSADKPDKKKKKDESEDKKETVSKKAVDEARAALTAFADSRAQEADAKLNAKLIDKLARAAKFAADAQNAKTKTEGKQEQAKEIPQLVADETIKGVPKKKPEKVSENEVEYKKAALAAMGFAVQPPDALKSDPGLPRRDGGKSTRRQDIFNELSGWSLGTE